MMTKSILCCKPAEISTAKHRGARAISSLIVIQLLFPVFSFAQQAPPPLGPPTYRSEKVQLGVGLLSGFVKTKVAEIVTEANKKISQQTKRVPVEAMPLKVFSPRRVATSIVQRFKVEKDDRVLALIQ